MKSKRLFYSCLFLLYTVAIFPGATFMVQGGLKERSYW